MTKYPRIEQLVSVSDAAERMHVTPATMRRWIAEGVLSAYRLGPRKLLIDPSSLDALLVPVTPTSSEGSHLKRDPSPVVVEQPATLVHERTTAPPADDLALFDSGKPGKPAAVGGRRRGPGPGDPRERCRAGVLRRLSKGPATPGKIRQSLSSDGGVRDDLPAVLDELQAQGLVKLDGTMYVLVNG